ncbi:MAG: MBL fold metallo-hydrolase [Lachnospiraceae bacterium]|nr:MBL fold metallo-hydrolase [Lachnospiraceae bacterium]
MKIKIHRGTHQIGGSITEIYTDSTHIFVDFGSELNTEPEDSTDAEMIDMMQHARCDAVLFTHYHGDHIGLMKHIPEKDVDGHAIKLGMGKVARRVLINIHQTLAGFEDSGKEHREYLDILQDEERQIDVEDGIPITVGDIRITPVLVDHSAYDAYLFIIEAQGKTAVHTGDFRTHGRLGKQVFERLNKALSKKTVDVLITEGTMMNRPGEQVLTEEEMQDKAYEILKKPENRHAFLICSSTNVESLASFANAAMQLKRAFYVNNYVYEQIKLYRETAGEADPAFRFRKTYKFESMTAFNPKLKMTQPEYMRENGFLMLIGASDAYKKRIEYFSDQHPLLIYSMWGGYVEKGADTYDEKMGALYHGWDPARRENLHTSGHATADDIRQMILTVKPQKYILPIHTEKPKIFEQLDIGENTDKIAYLNDNDVLEV